jgi:hypothetical protein
MKSRLTHFVIALLALAGYAAGQQAPGSLLRASDAEQIAAVNAALDRGLPPDDVIVVLGHIKTSLVLPLFEKKIEEVLRSASPADCFTERGIDPRRFVDVAAMAIAYAGDEEAMREMAKLVKLDEAQFGPLVGRLLDHSKNYSKSHNPFVVAYSGLTIGEPAVDKLIFSWAEKNLSVDPEERARAEAAARGFGPTPPPPAEKMKRLWADAMLDRYGGVPTDAQWTSDPIASRLSATLAESLHRDVPRFAREALEKRAPR